MKTIRTYKELIRLKTFIERYNYLRLNEKVGVSTFGFDRYLNQLLYSSKEWKRIRDEVIIRDMGCDLAIEGLDIFDKITIHHMNPITIDDVKLKRDYILNPEFLITTSYTTHSAIHFGSEAILRKPLIERRVNDTCPWKGGGE